MHRVHEESFDDDIISILKRIEQNLIHTNERMELHEKEINYLQNHQTRNQIDSFPSYIHFIFIIFLVIILRYIFH
jgi:hypothetical protein